MKEYMFIPTEMKATNRFDYECEAKKKHVVQQFACIRVKSVLSLSNKLKLRLTWN